MRTTQDLANSIRKAGSTAATFGVELNDLIGYTTAIGSTTRES
ncbi:phage tail tape measure protein, partial [Bacillus licheniformis]